MRPNKSLFFVIVGLAVAAVAAMVGAVFLYADALNVPTVQETIHIRVVVAPSARDWADAAARQFNQANRGVQVKIIEAGDLLPEQEFTADPPPAAWLAGADFAVPMAQDRGLRFLPDPRPVASTSLAWGGYTDKLDAFSQQYGSLSWDSLHAKATAPDDLLTLVIASPTNSPEGLAALISAVAAHTGKTSLSSADVSQTLPWLSETLTENTRTPSQPAERFATAQGRSIGDLGLLSLAAWRQAGLHQRSDFRLVPAEPAVYLPLTFAIYDGRGATPEGQKAAAQFRDFLLSPEVQARLSDYGFDPPQTGTPGVQIDGQAALSLFRWAQGGL
ncbi:MAG: hypothetical protein D6784_01490 [Chloroflexi bacterium]|nr:MAG: hypothetical protein D6784_01490 [Chloroflexota bacterium]